MQMNGEQRIAAPCDKVWAALNDPAVLRASIPGCQSLDKETDERFTALVEVKVGPIGARFKGNVTLTDINAPHGYTLLLEGNGGIAGSAKGKAQVTLSAVDGGTLISYTVDAEVGGRMAQLGGPIIDATAKQLAAKFFKKFGEVVVNGAAEDPGAAGAADTTNTNTAAVMTRSGATYVEASTASAYSMWVGIAIGLLLILVAGAAFEYGQHTATQHSLHHKSHHSYHDKSHNTPHTAPQIIVLSEAQLQQLIESRNSQAPATAPAPMQHSQSGAN